MKNLDSSDVRRARKSLQASFLFPLPAIRNNPKKNKRLAPFHLSSRFPAGAGTTTHLIEEVPQYDYLGLRRDEKLTTSPAKEAVLAKVNKALIPVFAAMGSLKYLKRHHNPSLASSPITPLQLWEVSVLPHYLPCLRYFHNPSHLDDLQHDLNRSLSRTLQVYGTYEVFLAETGTRPLYSTPNRPNLPNSDTTSSPATTTRSPTFHLRPGPRSTGPSPPPLPWNAACTRPSAPSTTPAQTSPAQCHPKISRHLPQRENDPTIASFRKKVPESDTPPYSCITPQKQAAWGHTSTSICKRPSDGPFMSQFPTSELILLRLRTQAWVHRIPSHLHYGKDGHESPTIAVTAPPRPLAMNCMSSLSANPRTLSGKPKSQVFVPSPAYSRCPISEISMT